MPNPNTILTLHYQDIQIADVTLQQQLQQYWMAGQFNEALLLLFNNQDQLEGKSFLANAINSITGGIAVLENYYNDNVTLFLSNLATQYINLINNFRKRSNWSSSIQYTPYNFVLYNQDIYMCIKQPPIGVVPTFTEYWLYLGLQGEDGVPGVNVQMKFNWEISQTYQPNDLVVYDSSIYVALKVNSGVTPGTDETTWLLFLTAAPGQIYLGVNPPTAVAQNTVWFQTTVDPLSETTGPIVGQLNRYNTEINNWEPIYLNTLYTWVDDLTNYRPTAVVLNIIIQVQSWINQQYTYIYTGTLNENDLIFILPSQSLNSQQQELYNSISVEINNNQIIFTSSIAPTVDLPIIIKIQ